MDGILGTTATKTSDLVLLAYVFLLLPGMIIGFFFARRKMFVPYHKLTMTGITLVNWVLIIFVMLVSYSNYIAPYVPENFSDIRAVVATLHLLSGAIAQGLATYLIILLWTERTRFEGLLPSFLRIRRIKTPMRLTLALWITTVVLGLGIYFTWYVGGDEDPSALAAPGATEQAAPGETPEASTGAENGTPPASTEDASANLAVTENSTPPAVTEDVTASTSSTQKAPAVTEEALPCPAVTEAVDDDDDDAPPPAVTEASRPCPAVTEDAQLRPAYTESADDDDDDDRDDDNSGSGSSNSGRGSDDDDNSGSGSSNSGSGSSNSGRDDNDDD